MVMVEPNEEGKGIEFDLNSVVIHQYGNSIKKTVMNTLKNLDVNDIKIRVVDKWCIRLYIKSKSGMCGISKYRTK